MTGSPLREHSEQFSLEALMKLEDERVAEQRRAQAAQELAALHEREEAERRRREEADAEERRAAEAQERARREELESVSRREAMQKALVEQTRLEVEVRARAEERELERRHELELHRLRNEAKKGELGSLAAAALLGGGVMFGVALAIHFGVTKPSSDRRVAELQTSIATEATRADELARENAEHRRRIESLDKTLLSLSEELAQVKGSRGSSRTPTEPRSPAPPGSSGPRRPPASTPAPVTCQRGDPMCPTIQR